MLDHVRDIVCEVPDGFVGTITIKFSSAAEPASTVLGSNGWPAQVDSILAHFRDTDPGHDHVAMAEHMRDLGFVAHPPQTRDGSGEGNQRYFRWIREGLHIVRLYQLGDGLAVDSTKLYDFALTVEGADPDGGVHPRVRFYYDGSSVDTVRAAARSLAGYADAA